MYMYFNQATKGLAILGLVVASLYTVAQETDSSKNPESPNHESNAEPKSTSVDIDLFSQAILPGTEPLDTIAKINELIAISEFETAIELASNELVRVERANGRFDYSLVEPLTLLGDCKVGMGDFDDALTYYDRARELSRQNLGLHELSQVKILYKEADTFLNQGKISEANDRHEYAFSLYLRQYGMNSVEQLPGLFSLADWYTDTYNIFAARGLYEHAANLARKNLDETDPSVLRALRGLAKTYKLEKFRPSIIPESAKAITGRPYGSLNSAYHYRADVNNFAPGEQALIDIVNIEMSRDDANTVRIAEAKLNLADWYLLFEKHDRANVMYLDVWGMFEDDPLAVFVEQELVEPKLLFKPVSGNTSGDLDDPDVEIAVARVEYKLTVTARGRTRNIERFSVEPPGAPTSDVRSSAKKARYRPAMVDGVPVATDDVSFVHTFEFTL